MGQHAADVLNGRKLGDTFVKRIQAPVKLLVAFAFCLLTLAPLGAESKGNADIIITNARIYTVDAKHPWAEALAISSERITAVGNKKDVEKLKGPDTKIIDAQGKLVLPGFVDCHIHFMEGSLGLTQVDLNNANTIPEIQKRVKEYAASHPDEPWIEGMGWLYPTFGPTALPNKKILDDIVPDRPVLLTAYDGHTTWANSKALQMAGITKDTPNPPNGVIVKDADSEPTGALKEHASALVRKIIPEPTREQRLDALRRGIREANRVGLTRVHSAGGDFEYLDLYDELRKRGKLTLRFTVSYFLDPPELTPENLDKIEWERKTYHDDWITGGVVKTMLDGVVESHTAAMLTPYTDDPTQIGKPFWDEDKYRKAVAELDKREIQVFTHAIGERAVRMAFDAYENAAGANHSSDRRHRIEHIETITAQDIPRFGKLGVIASFQPLHAEPNEDTLDVWARNAGPERSSRAWSWQSVAKSGGRLAFGSDWPVVTVNPWHGVYNALLRETQDGKPQGGWLPQQRVSLEQTIEAYTLGAAIAGHREKSEGSIETGKLADIIMVDRDLFKTPAEESYKTQVLLTMVGGKIVYQAPAAGTEKAK